MNKSLSLKFCRFGKKRKPFYRIGVLPVYRHPSRQFVLEFIGWYDPISKKSFLEKEKVEKYLKLNVVVSDSVKSLLIKNNFSL